MPRFRSYDGVELAYRTAGSGPLLVCLPGGPGQAVEYLGDLGGLTAHRTLVLLDHRGTGVSAVPDDPSSYRVDRLVADVEALRRELRLDRMDLLGHSASGGTALLYAAEHPGRLDRLVLIAPSLRVLGLQSDLGVEEVLAERADEPWYAEAVAALTARAPTRPERDRLRWLAAPLLYGEWGEAARRQAAAEPAQFSAAATDGFYDGFEPDPTLPGRLIAAAVPTLLVAGEHDIWPTRMAVHELARVLPESRLVVLPGAGHFPWVDDPAACTAAVLDFLAAPAA